MQSPEQITFSFGENWQAFLGTASEETFQTARQDIEEWLGTGSVQGKRVLDIGSGSGIHSLAFLSLGASELMSFDRDPKSVAATTSLWEKSGKPTRWTVREGSVLDRAFLEGLGWESFDIVYAWGVLHHTGAMWDAVENALQMVRQGGLAWLALYTWSSTYPSDLAMKQRYNAASPLRKKAMVGIRIAKRMWLRLRAGKNPFGWNEKRERGMDVYHDILDWVGGLPYEVAKAEDVLFLAGRRAFQLKRIRAEEANTSYLLSRQ